MRKENHWWRTERPPEEWRIYEDFRYFLWLVWKHLDLPEPTEIQYDIAVYLQHGPKRSIIEAFRGAGKSWITSAFACWLLLRDPQTKIMVVSASKERADQFSTFTLRLIQEMPILQHLAPKNNQRSSKLAFDVGPAKPDHSPSVKSVGIFGQLTGSRADVIIADDVEVPNNSETAGMRDKLSERIKEFDAVLKPGGTIKYLGTPQTEESIYNKLPERGYVMRVWPSKYPDPKTAFRIYADGLAPRIKEAINDNPKLVGFSTEPRRFSETDLMEREASYGRSGFALQFQLDTRLSDLDRYPLKLSDLLVMDLDVDVAPEKLIWSNDPQHIMTHLDCVGLRGDHYYKPATVLGDWIPYTGSVMFIDPSGRGKDETAYAVVKMLNGNLYVTAAGGLRGGYEDHVLQTLADIAKQQKINHIQIEDNFGDGMFGKLLQPYLVRTYPVAYEDVKHHRQKELRIIDTLEPVMNQHRLIVDRRIIEQDRTSTDGLPEETRIRYQLFYQMSRITKDRGALSRDDRIDALSGAVNYFVEQMSQDEEKRIQERQKRLIDAELQAFMGRAGMSIDGLAMGMTPEQAIRAARKGKNGYRTRL